MTSNGLPALSAIFSWIAPRRDLGWALILAGVYIACGVVLVGHHEMWRDELQAWLIARDSASIADMFANLKYEGHPGLWYLLLWPLTRLCSNPVSMQYLHLGIAALSVFLLARYSPFTRVQKALLVFGYFLFYEYAVVARSYALGVLLVFLFCAYFPSRHTRPLMLGMSLFLLSHTSVFGLIIALVMGSALVLEWWIDPSCRFNYRLPTRIYVIALVLILAGAVTAAMQMKPPPDSGFAVTWRLDFAWSGVTVVLNAIIDAYLPVPASRGSFWNTNIFHSLPVSGKLLLGGALVYLFARRFVIRPTALMVFLGGTLGLTLFYYVKYAGAIRHHGFLFVVLIAAAWIAPHCTEVKPREWLARLPELGRVGGSRLFAAMLSIQVLAGASAAYLDYRHVFSNAKRTAEFLQGNGRPGEVLVGNIDYAASAVAGYMEHSQFFYPMGDRFGSFIVWDNKREPLDETTLFARTLRLTNDASVPVVLVLNEPLSPEASYRNGVSAIAEFTGAVVRDENYYVYGSQ